MGHHHPSYDHGKVQATELLGCAENHLHSILNITNHVTQEAPKARQLENCINWTEVWGFPLLPMFFFLTLLRWVFLTLHVQSGACLRHKMGTSQFTVSQ